MRRKEKEITNREDILRIIKKCNVINLGIHNGEYPYVITKNYGCEEGGEIRLYFHGASEGKTPDLLRKNNKVGFMIYHNLGVDIGKTVCGSTSFFESVCGYGDIEFLEEKEDIERALRVLLRQSNDMRMDPFHIEKFKKMAVYALHVKELTCKISGKDAAAQYQNWANAIINEATAKGNREK